MPYINRLSRDDFDAAIKKLAVEIGTSGELNYVLSKLVHEYIIAHGERNYEKLNSIMGVFDCAKLEFYRQVVAPYEDKKILENGPVSELDK